MAQNQDITMTISISDASKQLDMSALLTLFVSASGAMLSSSRNKEVSHDCIYKSNEVHIRLLTCAFFCITISLLLQSYIRDECKKFPHTCLGVRRLFGLAILSYLIAIIGIGNVFVSVCFMLQVKLGKQSCWKHSWFILLCVGYAIAGLVLISHVLLIFFGQRIHPQQGAAPQGDAPQVDAPQVAVQHVASQPVPPQRIHPRPVPPQQGAAQHVTSQPVPPQRIHPQPVTPQQKAAQHVVSQPVPPQRIHPQLVPPQQCAAQHVASQPIAQLVLPYPVVAPADGGAQQLDRAIAMRLAEGLITVADHIADSFRLLRIGR